MTEPTSTIEPINPFDQSFMDRIHNYINQPLNTEDPIQNLVSGVADFIPGISTELAKRRGDKLGEALSYLDYIPGGAIPAEAISFVARRAGLLKKLKREQEILSKETDPREIAAAQKEITKLQKQIKKIDADKAKSPGTQVTEAANVVKKDLQDIGFPLKTKQGTLELADATKKTGRNSITKNIKSSSLIDEGASEAKEEILKQIGPDLFNFGLGSLKANKQGRKLDINDLQKLLTPPQMRMMDDMADSQNLFRVPASERLFNKKYNTLEPSMTGVDEYEAMIEALRNM